jgi:hypothetical protein
MAAAKAAEEAKLSFSQSITAAASIGAGGNRVRRNVIFIADLFLLNILNI